MNNFKCTCEVSLRFTESLGESLEVFLSLDRMTSIFLAVSVWVLQEADTKVG